MSVAARRGPTPKQEQKRNGYTKARLASQRLVCDMGDKSLNSSVTL